MNRRTLLTSALLFFASLLLPQLSIAEDKASSKKTKKARILFLTQSKGFRHGSVNRRKNKLAPAEIAMTALGKKTGLFDIDCTQDASTAITAENLKKYDIVMFYTTGVLPISDENVKAFQSWLKKKGNGYIGFHSATDTYRTKDKKHKWYWDISGGTFNGHPWNAGNNVTIHVHDPKHPAMKVFGKEFKFKDEIYQYNNWVPKNVRVLMSLDMAKNNPKRPYHVPVAWCRKYGDGKIFANNLGHNEGTWKNETFLKSTIGAIKWVLNMEEGDATPNPEVSKKWHEKSIKDTEEAKKKK